MPVPGSPPACGLELPARAVLLWLQFDGTAFCGFQRQGELRTVQGEFEHAWQRFIGEPARLRASSRTDSGVHARRMPVCVRTNARVPVRGLVLGLNTHLPADLAVQEGQDMPVEFDVRADALGKRYVYRMWTGAARSPLLQRTAWHVHGKLDVGAMRAAAAHFVGVHDFSAFRAAACSAVSTVRHLTAVDVREDGPLLTLTVEGNAFLHNMVRIVCGTLIDIGRGRFAPQDVKTMLESRDRTRAGQTAPAQGLMLDDVWYGPPGARQGLEHKALLQGQARTLDIR